MPASEDAVDRWTASTIGSVRKGFELGMDSSTASAAEVKGSELSKGVKERQAKKKEQRDYGGEEDENILREVEKKCMQDDVQGEKMSVMQVRRIKTVLKIQRQGDVMHSVALLLLAQISCLTISFITTALNRIRVVIIRMVRVQHTG